MSSCASAACQKLPILGLGIEVEVSEEPEISYPVKMSGFTPSESSMQTSKLEPEVVGRAGGPGGARWAGAARHIGHCSGCRSSPASGATSADCGARG